MTPRILSLVAFSLLVLTSGLFAKPYDPERSAPQGDYKFCQEFAPDERMHFHKHIKHKQMAREFRHEALRHREMARLHKREFMRERMGGPCPGPECPNGPEMRRERLREFRDDRFGQPEPGPMDPRPHLRRQMRLHDKHFDGPPMPPDHPQGPPPHMRFRDGKRPPRAL